MPWPKNSSCYACQTETVTVIHGEVITHEQLGKYMPWPKNSSCYACQIETITVIHVKVITREQPGKYVMAKEQTMLFLSD